MLASRFESMIFTCPSCSAGHSVPVSMIPSGGMEMSCRRCSAGFHVDMPERTQAGAITLPPEDPEGDEETPAHTNPEPTAVGAIDPPLPQNVEPTRIGVVTPFAEPEEPKPESLLSPSGQLYAPTARFEQPVSIDTKPDIKPSELKPRGRTPITHGRSVPPSAAEMGLDPELDDTMRVDSEQAGAVVNKQNVSLLDPLPELGRNAKTHVGDLSQGSVPAKSERINSNELSIGSGPNGLYERVAAGVYVPEEPKSSPPSNARVRAKSWDEPSAYLPPSSAIAKIVEPLRRAAVILNHAPLAFKVALVTFPLTLGIALMFTTTPEPTNKEPVEIAVPVQEASEAAAVETAPIVAPEEVKTASKRPLPPPKKIVMPGDDAAPEGHAYVQMDRARLRAEPGEAGEASGRLDLGQLVRTYEKVDGFVLVMAQPKGPAGFISEKLLGAKKPIAVLAKEIAFASCEVTEEYTIDDCLYQGKQQHDSCLEACGVAIGGGEDSPTVRCAEACKVAFNECQKSCNGEGDPKKRRPNTPARATRTAPRAQAKPR